MGRELTCTKCGLKVGVTNYGLDPKTQKNLTNDVLYTCAKCRGNATPKKVKKEVIKKETKRYNTEASPKAKPEKL